MQKNHAGVPVSLGKGKYSKTYYCSRVLGPDIIPGSDGQCGPINGPQCPDCYKSFPSSASSDEFEFEYTSVSCETGFYEADITLLDVIGYLYGDKYSEIRQQYPNFTKGCISALTKILREKLSEGIIVTSLDIEIINETYIYMGVIGIHKCYVIKTNIGNVLVTEDQNVSLYYGEFLPFEKTGELKAGIKWYHVFTWLCCLNHTWVGTNEKGEYFVSDESAKFVKAYISEILRKMFPKIFPEGFLVKTMRVEQLDENGNPRVITDINGVEKFLIFRKDEGIDVSIEIQDIPEGYENDFTVKSQTISNLMEEYSQDQEQKTKVEIKPKVEEKEQKEICEPRIKSPTCFKCQTTYRGPLNNSCCDTCSKKIVFITTQELFGKCESNWISIHQSYIDALKTRFGIEKSQPCCFKKTTSGLSVFCEMEIEMGKEYAKVTHRVSATGEHVKTVSNPILC
jgi:hypothetical protein